MNILEFVEKFKDELTCKAYLRDIRLKEGVTCKHCGGKKHYWLAAKWQFQNHAKKWNSDGELEPFHT